MLHASATNRLLYGKDVTTNATHCVIDPSASYLVVSAWPAPERAPFTKSHKKVRFYKCFEIVKQASKKTDRARVLVGGIFAEAPKA
jgi:hypothetical protein